MLQQQYKKKIGKYYLTKEIGKGTFSTVFQGYRESDNQFFAIKMIVKQGNDGDIQNNDIIDKEIQILNSLNHKNIVKLIDIVQTNNNWYLVFEYCENGDLDSYLKNNFRDSVTKKARVPEKITQQIVYQIGEAFKVLRENNIVHRDLKLQNILVSKDYVIKLADFGLAKLNIESAMMKTLCGTPITMAPEVIKRQPYNQKCDIWSIGVIIYCMLYGEYPFTSKNIQNILDNILKSQLTFPDDVQVSSEVKSLLKKMLEIDVEQRLNFDEFFNHPWVKGGKDEIIQNENITDLQKSLKNANIINKIDQNQQENIKQQFLFQLKDFCNQKLIQLENKIKIFEQVLNQIQLNDRCQENIPENFSLILQLLAQEKIVETLTKTFKLHIFKKVHEIQLIKIYEPEQLKNIKNVFLKLYEKSQVLLQKNKDESLLKQDINQLYHQNVLNFSEKLVIEEFILNKDDSIFQYKFLIQLCQIFSLQGFPNEVKTQTLSNQTQFMEIIDTITFTEIERISQQFHQNQDKLSLFEFSQKDDNQETNILFKNLNELSEMLSTRLGEIEQQEN